MSAVGVYKTLSGQCAHITCVMEGRLYGWVQCSPEYAEDRGMLSRWVCMDWNLKGCVSDYDYHNPQFPIDLALRSKRPYRPWDMAHNSSQMEDA